MDRQSINNKIKLNQTKLQIANKTEQRQRIQYQLSILRLQLQIEDLRLKIDQLESN
jgi:hypothetical protein